MWTRRQKPPGGGFLICDEFGAGFGWLEPGLRSRCSHALAIEGRVWIIDPLEAAGIVDRIRDLGEPAGVVQLLDRHKRACARFAELFGVGLHRVPFDGVPGVPLETLRAFSMPGWREAALWWPERRVLVCADAVGTAEYYRASGERLGVHPLLRLAPPATLAGLEPEHVLVGHGEGIHGPEATSSLAEALATARRRTPRWLFDLIKEMR